jgi:hypothetical protein
MPDIIFPSADGAAWSSARATEAGFNIATLFILGMISSPRY